MRGRTGGAKGWCPHCSAAAAATAVAAATAAAAAAAAAATDDDTIPSKNASHRKLHREAVQHYKVSPTITLLLFLLPCVQLLKEAPRGAAATQHIASPTRARVGSPNLDGKGDVDRLITLVEFGNSLVYSS